jgi:hypothetical protein
LLGLKTKSRPENFPSNQQTGRRQKPQLPPDAHTGVAPFAPEQKHKRRERHRVRSPKTPQYGERLDFHYSSILPIKKQQFFLKKPTYYTNIMVNLRELPAGKSEAPGCVSSGGNKKK